jgi:hypothetical protein
MKHVLMSGGLLFGEFALYAGHFLSQSKSEIGVEVLVTALAALLPAARHFAGAAFVALTEHGETITVSSMDRHQAGTRDDH